MQKYINGDIGFSAKNILTLCSRLAIWKGNTGRKSGGAVPRSSSNKYGRPSGNFKVIKLLIKNFPISGNEGFVTVSFGRQDCHCRGTGQRDIHIIIIIIINGDKMSQMCQRKQERINIFKKKYKIK